MGNIFTKIRTFQTECERPNIASSSSIFQNTTAAAIATENATINVENITVYHQEQTKNNLEKLSNIEFQLEDPIPIFPGRDEKLKDIEEAYIKSTNKQYNLVVLCGYGGIGKTELAKKYINKNRHEFENIIWINSESESSMRDNFIRLRIKMRDLGYSCSEIEDIYKHCNDEKCIFVFDNAENMKSICQFLPKQKNESLFLVTSHLEEWDHYESIVLDKLDDESAKTFIKTVLNERGIEITETHLQNLMKKCESVPLVLQIIVGYIGREINIKRRMDSKYNIEDIINKIDTKCEIVEEEIPFFSSNFYGKSIFTAVSQSLNKILNKNDEVSKTAADILGIAAYLNAEGIHEGILKYILECDDTNIFQESLNELLQFSLIRIHTRISDTKYILLHRTVQKCIRWHHRKNKNNSYYSNTLCILLGEDYFYSIHHEIIFKNGENYSDLIQLFYEKYKCRILHKNICASATIKILDHLKEKTNLIRDIEFLSIAVSMKRKDIDLIKDLNVNLDVRNNEGFNAFYSACVGNMIYFIWQSIENLVKNGANINSKNLDGNTVLQNLCGSGDSDNPKKDEFVFERCVLVILNGADTEIENNEFETASDIARKNGLKLTYKLLTLKDKSNIFNLIAKCLQFDLLQYLIDDLICDVNKQDNEGNTILHTLCALEQNDFKTELGIFYTVKQSFDCQNVNAIITNNSRETAECICSGKKRGLIANFFHNRFPFEVIFYIYYHGIVKKFPYLYTGNQTDVNHQDENGNTLLHVVCHLEEINSDSEQCLLKYVVHLVIEKEAKTNIKNAAGETVEDVARRRNRLLLADYFQMKTNRSGYFIEVARKYGNIDLAGFIWWRNHNYYRKVPEYLFRSFKSAGLDISEEEIFKLNNDSVLDVLNDQINRENIRIVRNVHINLLSDEREKSLSVTQIDTIEKGKFFIRQNILIGKDREMRGISPCMLELDLRKNFKFVLGDLKRT